LHEASIERIFIGCNYKEILMNRVAIIINDAPYGIEKPWNALRLAKALVVAKQDVSVCLVGDGVGLIKKGQQPPKGFYNLGKMLEELISLGAEVRACRTCTEARGLEEEDLIENVSVGGFMTYLAKIISEGAKVISF
jgi:uncharacterized protein involved in oxidation of intracellular sulfur